MSYDKIYGKFIAVSDGLWLFGMTTHAKQTNTDSTGEVTIIIFAPALPSQHLSRKSSRFSEDRDSCVESASKKP
jgi:hypothetical protein